MDIGCGPGNVTKRLSEKVAYRAALATDYSEAMVAHAARNYPLRDARFAAADISAPWEQVSKNLGVYEGVADLVFSNHTLSWVPDNAGAMRSVGKLLRPGGRAYVNGIWSWAAMVDVQADFVRQTKWKKYFLNDEGDVDVKQFWINGEDHHLHWWPELAAANDLKVEEFRIVPNVFHYDSWDAFRGGFQFQSLINTI